MTHDPRKIEAVAEVILRDLEDRRGIKQQFCTIEDESPEIYDEIKHAIGVKALDAAEKWERKHGKPPADDPNGDLRKPRIPDIVA